MRGSIQQSNNNFALNRTTIWNLIPVTLTLTLHSNLHVDSTPHLYCNLCNPRVNMNIQDKLLCDMRTFFPSQATNIVLFSPLFFTLDGCYIVIITVINTIITIIIITTALLPSWRMRNVMPNRLYLGKGPTAL